MTSPTAAAATTDSPAPLKLLDKALGALHALGFAKSETEEAPIVALIEQVSPLDPDTAAAIARTLSQASLFNKVVREQISAVAIGQRYREITDGFDSIREDAKRMVDQVEDGKISTFERVSNVWMKVTRGDVPHRFDKIKKIYLDVAEDTRDQIEREQRVLDAYADFRGALKESEVLGFNLLKKADTRLEAARAALNASAKALADGKSDDREATARLEMDRDLKLRALQDEDEQLPGRQGPGREPLDRLPHQRGDHGAPRPDHGAPRSASTPSRSPSSEPTRRSSRRFRARPSPACSGLQREHARPSKP